MKGFLAYNCFIKKGVLMQVPPVPTTVLPGVVPQDVMLRTMPQIRAAFQTERRGLVVTLPVADTDTPYPGLEDLFPAAERMQRAIADLSGIHSTAPDKRPWLRHAAWPDSYRPLVDRQPLGTTGERAIEAYKFVRVEGDGVHEIAVGPVHAGTLEPGHFRFSVVGEKVLRLEERLGYTHKGIEQRFTQLPILEAHRLAARVSGDSAEIGRAHV